MNMEAFNAHKDVQCTFLCALMYHHKSCQFQSMTLDDLDEYLYKVSFQSARSSIEQEECQYLMNVICGLYRLV